MMKAIQISSHGVDIDKLLTISTNVPKPANRKRGTVLIRVLACALAPGDIRVMKGHCDFFQEPPNGFPYIPGGDISGIIEEADKDSRFQKGDFVLAMFEIPRPVNGLAEFVCVMEELVAFAPNRPKSEESQSSSAADLTAAAAEAACLTSSAVAAWYAAEWYIQKNSRVLILGGSGGVGTFLIQLAKLAGASYIVATSTDEKLLLSLGADCVIDYRDHQEATKNNTSADNSSHNNIWCRKEFQENPFDVIFDLGVGGHEAWEKSCNNKIVKNGWNGGHYVTFSGDKPEMEIHNLWQTFQFVGNIQMRSLWTYVASKVSPNACLPCYVWHSGLNLQPANDLAKIVKLVEEGTLQVVFDQSFPPSPITLDSVKRAFKIMNGRKAHGKVVLTLSSNNAEQ